MENRFIFNLDLKQNIINNIKFQQGDISGSILEAHLWDGSVAKDITGAIVEFRFLKPDKTVVYQSSNVNIDQVTILDAPNGVVECVLNANTLATSGILRCEINLTGTDGSEITVPYFRLNVNSSIGLDGILSSSYISAIESIKDSYKTALHENISIELADSRHDDVNNIDYNDLPDRLNSHSQQINTNTIDVQALKSQITGAVNGSPIIVTLASQMIDHSRNYNYVGSESGYVSGNIYCWNGTSFADSGEKYQPTGIATEGVVHSNIKKKSVTGDTLGSESTIKDVLDYTKCTMLMPSGYIVAPNTPLTSGEIQLEIKMGTANSGYIYLLEKNVDNSVIVKNSLAYNFVSGINTINTGFVADGNGKEFVGFYASNIYANSSDVSTGYYWAIQTSNPTNTSYVANAVSTSHVNLAVKIKTLAVIGTTHIKDNQITLPKLCTDVIARFTNIEDGLIYSNETPKVIDFNSVTTKTMVTSGSHPSTVGRLWASYTPLTSLGDISIRIKAVKAISEYIVLLEKVSGTEYYIIDKQLVSIPAGINTIATDLSIDSEGEYYVGVTDRVSNSGDGTNGNFYYSSSTGNYIIETYDFDISTRTSIKTDNTDGMILTNYLFGLEVTIQTTVKQAIADVKGTSVNNTDIPKDIIYTEKFQSIPEPPYGSWIEIGTKGTYNNGYTPVADASFANYLYLDQVTNFDTDTVKWRIQLNDVTSKFRLARIANISIKTTTVEYDAGTIKLYGVTERFGFNTASSVLISKTLTIPLTNGNEYLFTLENFGFVIRFEVTNILTGDMEKIEWDCTNQSSAGLCMDYPLVSLASGSITIKQFDYFTKYSRNPKVIIVGDSVVEGITIKDQGGWQARWAYQVYQALNGDCAILAVGGESTVSFIPKLTILKRKFYRPAYVLLELMSNDRDFEAWKTNTEALIAWAESLGAVPVFCMMAKTEMPLDFYNSVLNYVTNSKYKIINFNRAMTQNGDGVTNISSLFLDDQIHPNQTGHARMFRQVQADLAEIFPLDY